MGNIVSSKPKLEINETDKAVLALKTQRRRLQDQQKRVMTQIDRENTVARELIAVGRKDRALLALKKRRIQETSLEKLDAWLLNVESVLANIETTANLALLTNTLKQGNDALKQMQQAVKLEDVERLMEDTAEAREYIDELQRILGTSLWSGEDELAFMAQLAELEAEVSADLAGELPSVPKTEIPAAKVEEEEQEELVLPDIPTHVPQRPTATEQMMPAS